jgi:hypothetical protein
MKTASRTLVKSPPELWELLDQPDRMQGLMCGLLGRATEVTVEEREPESLLRWEATDNGADAWIEVQLAEKGWGTNVKLKAENGGEPTKLEGWLDAVLEELATPQKRPFSGMGDAPVETVAEAVQEFSVGIEAPAEEPQREEPQRAEPAAPPAPPAPPAAEEPADSKEEPEAERPGRFRRFLGL